MKNYIKYCIYLKYMIAIAVVLICGGIYGWSRYHNSKQAETQTLQVTEGCSEQEESKNTVSNMSGDETTGQSESGQQSRNETAQAYVYVCGCVVNPGVYQCASDSRIYEVITQAGGFTEDADRTYLNLVDRISDGQKLLVPAVKENENMSSGQTDQTVAAKVNINTASKDQLMTLPGIGESKANDIIASRNTEGRFDTTEDIMRIPGIKEAAFNKLKDLISTK